jgi:N-methylhydantoinase A
MAAWRQDFVQTLIGRIGALAADGVEAVFAELAAAGRAQLARDGIAEGTADFRFLADLRYVGQEHAIPIPVEGVATLTGDAAVVRARFDAEHDRRYGQSAPSETLEVVALRLVLTAARGDTVAEDWLAQPWEAEGEMTVEERAVVFDDPRAPVPSRVYWRPSMPAGTVVTGPAVIEEPSSTILIHPGDRAEVAREGHLIVTLAGNGRG